MTCKYLVLPFINFFITAFLFFILQFFFGNKYFKNLILSFFVGIFFLIISNILITNFSFFYPLVVYFLLFYLLSNFLQQNKSGIQLFFLKKIYFSKNQKIKVNNLYIKNFEREKFNNTLKTLYALKIIKKTNYFIIKNKFIYYFYFLILLMRKLYNIKKN